MAKLEAASLHIPSPLVLKYTKFAITLDCGISQTTKWSWMRAAPCSADKLICFFFSSNAIGYEILIFNYNGEFNLGICFFFSFSFFNLYIQDIISQT